MQPRKDNFVQAATRAGANQPPAIADSHRGAFGTGHESGSRRRGAACANTLVSALLAVVVALPMAAHADFNVAQYPLNIGGQGIPGNLALVPSVEWPTINSVANLDPDYDSTTEYAGYFDSRKCYRYVYSSTESQRRFEPVSEISGNDFICSGDWSGNFLNWAATQTIDPFRKALTGGYRVKDTPTETWLEKAHHSGQGGTRVYPIRSLTNSTDVRNATPFSYSEFHVQIAKLGNEMRFWIDGSDIDNIENYTGGSSIDDEDAYDASVRVKVCDPSVGLESNCQPYDQGWKPEGVIQKNADKLRYSAFGYLNDHDIFRDGGVLRARNKFVGPTFFDPQQGALVVNSEMEWDPDTGVFIRNPSPVDAQDTEDEFGITINDSGVINYLNKFGQMTGKDHKSKDPVSELYYTALRYFRNLGDVRAYSDMSGESSTTKREFTDLFPVVTDWDDPIGAWCERNVILGIGDVNTHRDKNLPGNRTYLDEEPSTPSEVRNDGTVDVRQATNKVGELEGLGNTIANTDSWSGRKNSAYIAGLAYDAHTTDIRSDLKKRQSVSTFWVDVLEAQTLEAPEENQYYLAAKYGGFEVPEGFDPYTRTDPLPEEWWHTNGETLTSFGVNSTPGIDFKRADNYYTAGRARDMVKNLQKVFDDIVAHTTGSASSIAANSTRLDTGTVIYQARFDTRAWSGQLLALQVDPNDGTVDTTNPLWDAGDHIPSPAARSVFSFDPVSELGIQFEWNSLDTAQQDALDTNIHGINDGLGQQRLQYLLGDRGNEVQNGGTFRDRDRVLGDIVGSDPFFVGAGNFGYSVLAPPVGDEYRSFLVDKTSRRKMVYVGANDGMLYGFDATDGDEIFAYVPAALFGSLSRLTSPKYSHRYYVDGAPRAGDAYIDVGSGDEWRSILTGGLGAGGRSVFALDVTDPDTFGSDDVLWEFAHAELGLTMSQPFVVRMNDGEWYVVFGNGYESASGTARLFLVPLEDPSSPIVVDTEFGGTGVDANGMSAIIPVDTTGDRTTDVIYGGDVKGNLWKFDVTDSNTSKWEVAFKQGNTPEPLFAAVGPDGDPQPITATPNVGPHPDGGVMVYFGTGQFFEVGDNIPPATPQVQSFYAIHDSGSEVSGRGSLQEQTIVFEGVPTGADFEFRVTSDNTVTSSQDGWYIDLKSPVHGREGERVISRATVRNDRVIFVTNIPSGDACGFGGDSWVMEMHAVDGKRLNVAVFDVDGSGSFDAGDIISYSGDSGHAGGRKLDEFVSQPAILDTAGVKEFKYLSGSSGSVLKVEESGSVADVGRQSWRELLR